MNKKIGFELINHFSEPCITSSRCENAIYSDIIKNKIVSFRKLDYAGLYSHDAFYRARYYLISQAQIIVVKGVDYELYSLGKHGNYKPNELICITFQSDKLPFEKKYPQVFYKDEYKALWIDTYNNWCTDYAPKIWEGICL